MKKLFTLFAAALCSVGAFAADGFKVTCDGKEYTADAEITLGYEVVVSTPTVTIVEWPSVEVLSSKDMTAVVSLTSQAANVFQLCIGECVNVTSPGQVITQEGSVKANTPFETMFHRTSGPLTGQQAKGDATATLTISDKANSSDKIVLKINCVVKPNSEVNSVGSLEVDDNAPVTFYSILGIQLREEPTSGIYIRRQGNKAVKVIK